MSVNAKTGEVFGTAIGAVTRGGGVGEEGRNNGVVGDPPQMMVGGEGDGRWNE